MTSFCKPFPSFGLDWIATYSIKITSKTLHSSHNPFLWPMDAYETWIGLISQVPKKQKATFYILSLSCYVLKFFLFCSLHSSYSFCSIVYIFPFYFGQDDGSSHINKFCWLTKTINKKEIALMDFNGGHLLAMVCSKQITYPKWSKMNAFFLSSFFVLYCLSGYGMQQTDYISKMPFSFLLFLFFTVCP